MNSKNSQIPSNNGTKWFLLSYSQFLGDWALRIFWKTNRYIYQQIHSDIIFFVCGFYLKCTWVCQKRNWSMYKRRFCTQKNNRPIQCWKQGSRDQLLPYISWNLKFSKEMQKAWLPEFIFLSTEMSHYLTIKKLLIPSLVIPFCAWVFRSFNLQTLDN